MWSGGYPLLLPLEGAVSNASVFILLFLIPPVFSLFPLLFHGPPFLCCPLLCVQAEDDVVLLAAIPLAVLDSSLCWWISATAPLLRLLLSLFLSQLVFAESIVAKFAQKNRHRDSKCGTQWSSVMAAGRVGGACGCGRALAGCSWSLLDQNLLLLFFLDASITSL